MNNFGLYLLILVRFVLMMKRQVKAEQVETANNSAKITTIKTLLPSLAEASISDGDGIGVQLEAGEVTIKGARYRAFKSRHGTIYLPRLHHFTPSDIELARCTSAEVDRTVIVERGNTALSNRSVFNPSVPLVEVSKKTGSVKFYVSVIQETIRRTCGSVESYRQTVDWNPSLEIGVSYEAGEKNYTFFLNPLAGLLGFRVEF